MRRLVAKAIGKIGRPEFLRKLDDAAAGNTRNFRNIGGQSHIPAVLERFQHRLESGDTAFDVETRPMIA